MKRSKKLLLALCTAACSALIALPCAYAEPVEINDAAELEDLFSQGGEGILMQGIDNEIGFTVASGVSVVLDLNDNSIVNMGDAQDSVIVNNGSLEIIDTMDWGNAWVYAIDHSGDYVCIANNGSLSIKGGSYDVDPSDYVAEGYKAVEEYGYWRVQAIEYEAVLNGTNYEHFTDALEAAQLGDTITILQDYVNLECDLAIDGITVLPAEDLDYGYISMWEGAVLTIGENHPESTFIGTYIGTGSIMENPEGVIVVKGGYFSKSSPFAYLAVGYYLNKSDVAGYKYKVTDQQPSSAPIFASSVISSGQVSEDAPEGFADLFGEDVRLCSIEGVEDALSEEGMIAILRAAGIEDADIQNPDNVFEIMIFSGAELVDGAVEGDNPFMEYELYSAFIVVMNGVMWGTAELDDSMLNGNIIKVTLFSGDFVPGSIKHVADDASLKELLGYAKQGYKNGIVYNAEDKTVSFGTASFSSFIISTEKAPDITPATGDGAPVALLAAFSAAALGAVLVLRRKAVR